MMSNPFHTSSPRISTPERFSQLTFLVLVDKRMFSFLLDCKLQGARGKIWLCLSFHHQDLARESGTRKCSWNIFEWMNVNEFRLPNVYPSTTKPEKSYCQVFLTVKNNEAPLSNSQKSCSQVQFLLPNMKIVFSVLAEACPFTFRF